MDSVQNPMKNTRDESREEIYIHIYKYKSGRNVIWAASATRWNSSGPQTFGFFCPRLKRDSKSSMKRDTDRKKERKKESERERERAREVHAKYPSISINQNEKDSISFSQKNLLFFFFFFFWPREDSIEFNYLDCNLSKRKEDVVREEAGNNNIEGKKKIMWMQLKMEMSQIYGGLSVWFLLFRAELSGGLAAIYWQFHRRLFLISTRSDCRWKITWLPASTRL